MAGWLRGWRVALRLARREALRARGRSALMLVMIGLPVLAITAADVVIHTQQVTGVESLERRMGAAEARVTAERDAVDVEHGFDPDHGSSGWASEQGRGLATADEVAALLPDGARLVPIREAETFVTTATGGRANVGVLETDLADDATSGLLTLTSGAWPDAAHEVVVNRALADKGYAVGEVLDLDDDAADAAGAPDAAAPAVEPVVVGIAESAASTSYPVAAGPPGSLVTPEEEPSVASWLVADAAVDWTTVRALNGIGATVASRAVITDPPSDDLLPDGALGGSGLDSATTAVLALVVVMVLLELVLLAGPAFAVGARRMQRSLALLVASGGTPQQARRAVLASAVVLGSVAAALGVLLGVGLAALAVPLVQRLDSSRFGPFEVPWLQLAGVAGFGLLSAFLAAVVPAVLASRQDVVAVLAGRRADARPSLRSPVVGAALLGVGVLGSVLGATRGSGGEMLIAASAVPTVLGMVLLVPVVLALVGRLGRSVPLPLRYALRDAARHRTRTVPAVAAVAATVTGVVALGISITSDEAENRETYRPSLAAGAGLLTVYAADPDWDALVGAVERVDPDVTTTPVRGVPESWDAGPWSYVEVADTDGVSLRDEYGSSLGASVLVGRAVPPALPGVAATDRARAGEVLAAGGVVAFTDGATGTEPVVVRTVTMDEMGNETARDETELEALLLPAAHRGAGPLAVLSPGAADRAGVAVGKVGVVVEGDLSEAEEQEIGEQVAAVSDAASFYVERGYQGDDETLVIQLVLAGLGAVLMLGGTLTATFLALSDARPDLATLSAVGASPRTRRAVAASYALVVGGLGALLGALVGFVPGIAVTYPLTGQYAPGGGHFLDVPWLMVLGVVVVLPLLTAALVGVLSRPRLPLVSRLR
ncbi:FtsX-like permease family protein [Nocardioides sp. SYSU D00038]|uniref:FtsX-like permease family protein n=1 Tax=Nocardioides sp. SYSU D00038 TaxID=2812554 RepID=UPI001967C337|nr:FtsX-like permease family protein [Nocardioides sp. SYSU D00038]